MWSESATRFQAQGDHDVCHERNVDGVREQVKKTRISGDASDVTAGLATAAGDQDGENICNGSLQDLTKWPGMLKHKEQRRIQCQKNTKRHRVPVSSMLSPPRSHFPKTSAMLIQDKVLHMPRPRKDLLLFIAPIFGCIWSVV
jgi:hypothetical protein